MKHKKTVTKRQYQQMLAMKTVGNMLILTSLFFMVKTFYAPVSSEISYFFQQLEHKKYVVSEKPAGSTLQDPGTQKGLMQGLFDRTPETEVIQPVDTNFGIVIPKIGANSTIQANVDAGNEDEYLPVLERAVAHVKGTAFPGEHAHIYLFAHSTDYFWNVGNYNAIFYLLYKLQKGDEVDLFYKDQKYKYVVSDTTIVDPSRVEYITQKTSSEFLTLQTCWPPGTTLLRLLVFAKRVAE